MKFVVNIVLPMAGTTQLHTDKKPVKYVGGVMYFDDGSTFNVADPDSADQSVKLYHSGDLLFFNSSEEAPEGTTFMTYGTRSHAPTTVHTSSAHVRLDNATGVIIGDNSTQINTFG